MKVRPTVAGSVIRFPSNPNRLVPDEGCEMPTSGVDAEHFNRLLRTKELEIVPGSDVVPTGREPVTPFTTR